jgi:hypothetical protein
VQVYTGVFGRIDEFEELAEASNVSVIVFHSAACFSFVLVFRFRNILRSYHAKPPHFGDGRSPWPAVSGLLSPPVSAPAVIIVFAAAFYTFWTGFSSKRPMAAAEKWDIRDAPNRDTR